MPLTEPVISPTLKFINEKQKKNFRVWAWIGGHADWDLKRWDSTLAFLQISGINGLLVQGNPAELKRIIPLAQKHRITVEKWFIAMMNNDRELIRAHPGWFVISREEKSCITDPAYVKYYRFLCPSNPEVREYLKKNLDEYLEIQGLAGIHLDYIRYPDVILPKALWDHYGIIQDKEYAPYDYCYCTVCRDKFRFLYDYDPLIRQEPEKDTLWRQFRYDQVRGVVKEISTYVRQKGLKLSAAVFPGPSLAKELVRQEWDKWPLDEVMPMLYNSFYHASLAWIGNETREGIQSLKSGTPLYSGLYVPALSPRELQTAIRKSFEAGANGFVLFNYEAMNNEHWNALMEVMGNNRQSGSDLRKLINFRL